MKKHLKKLYKKLPQLDEAQMMFTLSVVVGVVALALLVWFGIQFFAGPRASEREAIEEFVEETQEAMCEHMRVLDGVCVENENDVNPKVVIVTVENHFEARPQAGLSEASIVYEAPVEANITRFLALYPATADVGKVGPVRSVRPYFLDWISEYADAAYMHVGGSPDALTKLRSIGTNGVNEMTRGWFFWRSTDRYAPHNTYTSSKLWNKALDDYSDKYESTEYDGWKFSEMDPCEEDCITSIVVTFSGATYRGTWNYDEELGQYARYQTGSSHRDQKGLDIMADTVVVQHVETSVLDGVGRLGMDTLGEGVAIIFRDGHMISGTWKKESRTERTRFFDENDEEIGFKAGKIWVEVVNGRGDVEFE